jgi:hypothetical protein
MKTMIPTTRSLLLILLFPVVSLTAFIPVTTSDLPPVYTAKNKLFAFGDNSTWFIVLKNDRNCHTCFESMNDYVSQIRKNYNCRYAVIIDCDSTALDRKRSFADTRLLMPDFDTLLFQYRQSPDNFFRSLHVNYTPEIIILKNGKVTNIQYKDIFDPNSMNLSVQTQTQISRLLNAQ